MKYIIKSDTDILASLLKELKKDEQAVIQIHNSDKRITGLEIVELTLQVTSTGAAIISAWLAANQILKDKIEIKEIDCVDESEESNVKSGKASK